MRRSRIRVLLVEDSADDVNLLTSALRRVDAGIDLDVVTDGHEALHYLRRVNSYARAVLPDVILLDLNTPKKNGLEVISEVKADKDLACIPIVVMTTSSSPVDIKRAYQHGAACYVTKPQDFEGLKQFVRNFFEFWRMAEFAVDHGPLNPVRA
ncbi:MAG TPA: response regulator [Opitutaceae bacterium]|nr:response regulator [Opitutaceae bacterium]